MFSLCFLLGFIESNLDELALIMDISFNAESLHTYLIRERAVAFRQVIVAEVSSSIMTD
jgi:hypothetical protein